MHVRNVCKECLANGYSLKLNEDLLCSKCANLLSMRISNASFDELAELVWSESEEFDAYNKAYEAKSKREEKNFNFIFDNFSKARELEKDGCVQEALNIYLKIVEYCPPGTDYYTRPCIILEKQKEYAKAIEICDLAIKHIREGRFNADEEEFNHRKERLIKKMSKE